MADAQWTIKQWNPTGTAHLVHKFPVWTDDETGALTPDVTPEDAGLRVAWLDGRIELYPWCSIVKVEYQPPNDQPWPGQETLL